MGAKEYLDAGQTVKIKIERGLDTFFLIKATVIHYLGNDEYVVEGENGNRYIRGLEDINVSAA